MTELYPIWGRELSEYPGSYSFDASLHRPNFDSDTETTLLAEAQESIRQICELEGDNVGSDLDDLVDRIHIPTLQSVLNLALSPHTLHFLACPPLISGCIKLMSTVKQSGKPSPFSYEYGYLCFRIITTVFGASLLKRTNKLDTVIAHVLSEPETPVLEALSQRVCFAVRTGVKTCEGGPFCDWILGWARLEEAMDWDVLVPLSDVAVLLELLWTDRKQFLKAFTKAYSPGLSGVMFLIWRYRCLEREPRTGYDPDSAIPPVSAFCEIIFRCWLVAPTDQWSALQAILNSSVDIVTSAIWKAEPTDLEDCRTVLCAYNSWLAPTNMTVYHDPSGLLDVIYMMLEFVSAFVRPGVEDLLPSLFGSIIGYIHERLPNLPQEGAIKLNMIGHIFIRFIGKFHESLRDASPAILLKFIAALTENDLLGLIARTLLVTPLAETADSVLSKSEFGYPLDSILCFVRLIGSRVPREVLQSTFNDTFPDWLKYNDHLLWRKIMAVSKKEHIYFNLSLGYWDQIAQSLQQDVDIERVKRFSNACSYARCPDPFGISGSRLSCSRCDAPYCSSRCQAADWLYSGWQQPHEERCKRSIQKC